MGKFVPKISIFTILGAVSPHLKAKTVKIGMSVRTWDFLFHAKFCIKKSLAVYPFGENLYQ